MNVYFAVLSAVSTIALAASDAADNVGEPMVAFLCNRPAMRLTEGGWTKDEETNCLKDPVDILNYCRKMYPKLDVWNIVEASEPSTIKNWCNFGRTRCHNKLSVRPYRCLIGSFESEALEVPENCQFDHVHSAEQCKSYGAWNETTSELCAKRRMYLRGFSILQPCAIDEFSGAEYVCCPVEEEKDSEKRKVVAAISTTSTPTTKRTKPSSPTTTTTTMASSTSALESDYLRYLRNPIDQSLGEHEYYLHAKADLDKRHHEKVTKMMKEWAGARHRVQEIKKTDVKAAEKFNREMTARFQKAYDTLEREGVQQKRQLSAVHQQRVQTELNKKKRLAMDAYLEALHDIQPDAATVLKSLMHYIKTEQKDRIHTINHYQHVQESDPVEAESIRSDVADHLRGTDQRVTKAIDMLGQLPKYEKKIRTQIEKFLSSYQSLDESLSVIMTKINEQSNTGKKLTRKTEDKASTPETVERKTDLASTRSKVTVSTATSTSPSTTTIQKHSSATGQSSLLLSTPHSVIQTASVEKEAVSVEIKHHSTEIKPVEHVAFVDKSDLVVLENYIKKRPVKAEAGLNVAAPLGIAIGGIAVFVAIVVGIAFLRRRVAGAPTRHSVTEVDRRATAAAAAAAANPDTAAAADKKVPQINGYENPTYQYYAANA